ncbi:histidine kinase [Streptomyces sp. NPDC048002]|uniref:sensor histidine kinase n=1 Tax=Streptomyces sp. NPDC048002 TaxID=3154344 RepID=UPI0033F6297A
MKREARVSGGWWRRKSTPAKVETYTRWSFHFFGVAEIFSIGVAALNQGGTLIGGWLLVAVCGHSALTMLTASRALDWTRGRREQPVRLMWTLAVITAVIAVAALALVEHGPGGKDVETAAGTVFGGVTAFGAGTLALGVRERRRMLAVVGGFAAGAAAVTWPLGLPAAASLATGLVVLLGGGFIAFTSAFSVWLLNAVYELDEARETRARLAVAEERLRFGRDLHDVMGRNLAVIALKSELAVQLARRERPEAVEQMIEVQRIARESQREVRDVVRGYRETDLGVELAGAKGVLTAAGIDCEVSAPVEGLPAQVQSALGWVVREATTNVLRHGDAERCAVSLRVREGRVVLVVENNGLTEHNGMAEEAGAGARARESEGPARAVRAARLPAAAARQEGSGLAGLRERLLAVDGTLQAGPVEGGVFRVVAEVPLTAVVA